MQNGLKEKDAFFKHQEQSITIVKQHHTGQYCKIGYIDQHGEVKGEQILFSTHDIYLTQCGMYTSNVIETCKWVRRLCTIYRHQNGICIFLNSLNTICHDEMQRKTHPECLKKSVLLYQWSCTCYLFCEVTCNIFHPYPPLKHISTSH